MNLIVFICLFSLPIVQGLGWKKVNKDEVDHWNRKFKQALDTVKQRLSDLRIIFNDFVVFEVAEFPPSSVYASIQDIKNYELNFAVRFDKVYDNEEEYILGYMPTMFEMEKVNRAYALVQKTLGETVEAIGGKRGFTSSEAVKAYFDNSRKQWDLEAKQAKRLTKLSTFCNLLKAKEELNLANATLEYKSSYRYETRTEVFHYVVFETKKNSESSSSSSAPKNSQMLSSSKNFKIHCFKRQLEPVLGAALQHLSLKDRVYSVVEDNGFAGIDFRNQVLAEDFTMQYLSEKNTLKWVALNALEEGDPLKKIVLEKISYITARVESRRLVKPVSVYVHVNNGQPSIYIICQDLDVNKPFTFARLGSDNLQKSSSMNVQYVKNVGRFSLSKLMHHLEYPSEDDAEKGAQHYLKEHDCSSSYSGRYGSKCEVRELTNDAALSFGNAIQKKYVHATNYSFSYYHVFKNFKINSGIYAQVLSNIATKLKAPLAQLSILSETLYADPTQNGVVDVVKHLYFIVKRVISFQNRNEVQKIQEKLVKRKIVKDENPNEGWQTVVAEDKLKEKTEMLDYLLREDVLAPSIKPLDICTPDNKAGSSSGFTHNSYVHVKVALRGRERLDKTQIVEPKDTRNFFDVTEYKLMYIPSGAEVEEDMVQSILRPRWEVDRNFSEYNQDDEVNNKQVYHYPPLSFAIFAAEVYVTDNRTLIQNENELDPIQHTKPKLSVSGVTPNKSQILHEH